MIKKFFAKLTGWNSMENKQWQKSAAERLQEDNARQRELAEERRQRNLDAVSEGERLRRQAEELRTQTKKHQEAA